MQFGSSLALASWLGGCAAPRVDAASELPVVAAFSDSPADGRLPLGWDVYRARPDLHLTRYATASADGTTILRAWSDDGASGLRCRTRIDPVSTPWLNWRWRAQRVPDQARADQIELDDSPARVAIAFDGDIDTLPPRERQFFDLVLYFTGQRLPFATLMYIWDATLPAGAVASYARSARIQYVVVEGGTGGVGRWLSYRRHVVDDYIAIFGQAPGPITSVGVMTDADDLKQPLQTDYGDIRLTAA